MSNPQLPDESRDENLRESQQNPRAGETREVPRKSWTGTVVLVIVIVAIGAMLLPSGTRRHGHGATQSSKIERAERMQQIEQAERDASLKSQADDQSHAEPNGSQHD